MKNRNNWFNKGAATGSNPSVADLVHNTLSDTRQNWNLFAEIPEEILFNKIASGLPRYPAAVFFLGIDCVEKRNFVQKARAQYFSDWQSYVITQAEGYVQESKPMLHALEQEAKNVVIEFREAASIYHTLSSGLCALQLRNHTTIQSIVGVCADCMHPTWDDSLLSDSYNEEDMIEGQRYIRSEDRSPWDEDYDYYCEQCLR